MSSKSRCSLLKARPLYKNSAQRIAEARRAARSGEAASVRSSSGKGSGRTPGGKMKRQVGAKSLTTPFCAEWGKRAEQDVTGPRTKRDLGGQPGERMSNQDLGQNGGLHNTSGAVGREKEGRIEN